MTDARYPVAYIRRSVQSKNDPGDVSRATQTDAVRKLAGTDDPRIIDSDWGISASRDKITKRLGFLSMVAAIERGEVSTVYAYASDRLARDVEAASVLLNRCEDAGTLIVTGEGRFAPGDDMARQLFHFQAVQNEGAWRQMKKRARAGRDQRQKRGDDMGHIPWGMIRVKVEPGENGYPYKRVFRPDPAMTQEVERVLSVVRETSGNMLQSVRLLNERGIPSPKGKTWHTSALTRIIGSLAPELLPPRNPGRRRIAGRALLAQLLRCHCGQLMTANVARGQYYCYRAHRIGAATHGKGNLREVDVLPWIGDRYNERWALLTNASGDEREAARQDRISELQEAKRKLTRAYALIDGEGAAISDEEYEGLLARYEAELDDLREGEPELPSDPVDWRGVLGDTSPTGEVSRIVIDPDEAAPINRDLRAVIRYVQLDKNLRPVEIAWRQNGERDG